MTSTFTDYKLITKNLSKSLERKGDERAISRETDYFYDNIEKIKTIDDFFGDRRLYTYAMTAYGLEDMIYAKAFMRKVLTQEPDKNGNTLVNRLQDPRYQAIAKVFNFGNSGQNFLNQVNYVDEITDKYVRQKLETSAGEDNEGVRLALYFQRQASTIKSPYSILADKALAQVVRTAFGMPDEAAKGSIDAQANLIKRKLDISSLQDPDKLDKFLKRFTIMWDLQNSPPSAPALQIFGGSDTGLSADLLMKLQSIRFGGR